MPKKILVAEKSDAIRSIAESLLHQNGYDAIAAANSDKAKELIITTQPNMVILGADLMDSGGRYLYDLLEENPATSSIPIILIADPTGRSLPYPDEVILPRPFDPKDFLDRVRLFVGGGIEKKDTEKIEAVDPFSAGSIDDEFLDAALGIDNIDVESSEVMDKNFMTGKLKIPQPAEKTSDFGIHRPEYDDSAKKTEENKVESLMIREEGYSAVPKSKLSDLSASSKIEIASDQYGLINPDEPMQAENKNAPHDYDWFIKEMQKETPPIGVTSDSSSIKITPTSDSVEPISPSLPKQEMTTPSEEAEKPEIKEGGVDKFIEDFKKEMEELTSSMPEIIPMSPKEEFTAPPKYREVSTEIDPEEIRHFSNYLAELLAERLAKEIVSKINPEEIYRIVREDLIHLIAAKK
jgi:hypothetical protein